MSLISIGMIVNPAYNYSEILFRGGFPVVEPWVITVIAVCVAGFLVFVIQRVVRAHHRQAAAGREELVGKTAEVEITLEPKGIVLVEGERWTAISEKGRVEPGEEVTITKVDGLKLYVTKK